MGEPEALPWSEEPRGRSLASSQQREPSSPSQAGRWLLQGGAVPWGECWVLDVTQGRCLNSCTGAKSGKWCLSPATHRRTEQETLAHHPNKSRQRIFPRESETRPPGVGWEQSGQGGSQPPSGSQQCYLKIIVQRFYVRISAARAWKGIQCGANTRIPG